MKAGWIIGGVSLALAGQGGPAVLPAPQAQVAVKDPARLEITPRGRVKIPSLGPREKKTLHYTFRNLSSAPITLRVVDLAPGVTLEGAALQQPIPGGGTAPLSLTVDPTGFTGWQRRNARLTTDDPRQGDYLLPVDLTIRPDLTVDAPRKGFGEVGSHERPELVFRFTRETGDPTQLRVVSPLPDHLTSEVAFEGKVTELKLFLHPPKVALGVALGLETLLVETNSPLEPKFTLYADWTLRRAVEASPARLVFLDPAKAVQALALSRRDGKPFAIAEARVEGDGFKVGPLPRGKSVRHRLQVKRVAAEETRATLFLKFVDEAETLAVPLAHLPAR